MKRSRVQRLTWALGVAVASMSGFASAGQAKDKFIFAWPSAINSGVAPLSFARQLGYFDAENLDVQVQVLTGSGVIVPQLLAGKIDAAYASLEPLVISRQPGRPNFPLRFVYNLFPRSIWEFVVPAASPIKQLSDLKGKTIGELALGSGNIFMTRAILQDAGVKWSDVKVQAVGTGVAAFEALRSGQIDVLNLFDTAHVRLEQSGVPIRRLEVPARMQNLSSHGIQVTEEKFTKNAAQLEGFGRALTKGIIACNANLPACIRAYWANYPELAPKTGTDEDNLKAEVRVLKVRMQNLLPPGRGTTHPYGSFTDDDWKELIEALKAGGEVTDAAIPMNTLYSNALVPAYNRFDVKAVEAQAKAQK